MQQHNEYLTYVYAPASVGTASVTQLFQFQPLDVQLSMAIPLYKLTLRALVLMDILSWHKMEFALHFLQPDHEISAQVALGQQDDELQFTFQYLL